MEKAKKVRSFASIFGDEFDEPVMENNGRLTHIRLDQLVPFHNHPFRLYEGEQFKELVDSIKNYGVIVPIVVQKKESDFEILSGHNRAKAAKEAGLDTINSIVKEDLTEEEAILIVTETNLMQRSFTDLAHSERAKVITTRHEAIKKQGIRTDLLKEIESLSSSTVLTSCPVGTKLDSKKDVGSKHDISARTVARYLRIDKLDEGLLICVDEGKISMRAGVDLSYLSENSQKMVHIIISESTFKLDMKKASMIRKFEEEGKLTMDNAKSIISGEVKRTPNKERVIKIHPRIIAKYFNPPYDKEYIEKVMIKALDYYYEWEKKNEDEVEEDLLDL